MTGCFFETRQEYFIFGIYWEGERFWTQSKIYFQEWQQGEYWNEAWIPFMKVDDVLRVVDTKGCFGGIPGQIISF